MADGIPIYHEVYLGNTVDPSMIENTIRVLKEKFQIKDVIFVEDRTFGRKQSLKILDENQYITAAYRWDQPYRGVLMSTAVTEEDKIEDLYIKEVSIKESDKDLPEELANKGKRRYIFVYNPEREKQDLEDLDRKIEAVEKILTEQLGKEETKNKLGNLRPLVSFKGNEIKLNDKKIKEIKSLAGRFLIITNSSLGKEEAVKTYKDLCKIERAFRTIKSFIEIRPIYHRKTERIRAHVFISVLSLLIGRIIEKKTGKSISRVMDILSRMEAIPVKIGDKIITIRNESEECKELLKDLDIKYPDRVL
ncbi:MAG: IS1634 family transposase [Thermoplasmata archaeon]